MSLFHAVVFVYCASAYLIGLLSRVINTARRTVYSCRVH